MMNNQSEVRETWQEVPLPRRVRGATTALLFAALALPMLGQSSVGLVGGVTRDVASGKPLAKVQIVARNLDKARSGPP
jgi:hypothetical protein